MTLTLFSCRMQIGIFREENAVNTAAIIEKWYRKIGFDPRYDRAFYDALATILINADAAFTVGQAAVLYGTGFSAVGICRRADPRNSRACRRIFTS